MKFISDISKIKFNHPVITIGKFDGFHLGHIKLFETAVSDKKRKGEAIVFMLDAKPLQLKGDFYEGDILSFDEKKNFAYPEGIDAVIFFHFNEDIMRMPPEEFISEIMINKLNAKEIVVGSDFCFGKDRAGNVELLKEFALKYEFKVTAVPEVKYKGEKISSSRIKKEIKNRNFDDVGAMLGRPFSLSAKVSEGEHLGKKLGFPTVNMNIPEGKLMPPLGSYATKVIIDGKSYAAMSNIGTKPTVKKSGRVNLETHILDFSGNLYGEILTVEFYKFIRPEEKFADIKELSGALKRNEKFAREYFLS